MYTVNSLIKSGCEVIVEHVRDLGMNGVAQGDGIDSMLSKREFYEAKKQNTLFLFKDYEECLFGDYVSSTGGFTRVTVKFPDGTMGSYKHNFNKKKFVKRIGLDVCIGKIMKSRAV